MDDDTRQDGPTVPDSPMLEEQAHDESPAQYEGDGPADRLADGFTTPDVDMPEFEVLTDEDGGDDVDAEPERAPAPEATPNENDAQ